MSDDDHPGYLCERELPARLVAAVREDFKSSNASLMNRTTKIKITELNPHVICVLCGGYYIDATSIVECLHSFCRTCIIKYLETSKYCPICDVMVHKTRPLDNIRSDKTLQDLVYKLVPGLYKREMRRRREYYTKHPVPGKSGPSEDHGDEFHDRIIYTEDEKISLSIELCADGIPFKTPSSVHSHNGPTNIKVNDVRFLCCPAAFTVGNLKKFIRMKFDLNFLYEIDVFQTAEPLPDYYTLMDIAYIYTWTRRSALRLFYTVYERLRHLPMTDVPADVTQTKETDILSKPTKSRETAVVTGVKRKLPEDAGEDVVLPRLTANEGKAPGAKKDGGAPKKRTKKAADNRVIESEEQLAKLSLNSSIEGASEKVGREKEIDKVDNVVCVDKADTDASGSTFTEKNKTAEKPKQLDLSPIDDVPISLSLFQPLNVETNTKEPDGGRKTPNTPKPSAALPKAKGTPGRKKAGASTDAKLVISKQHPGLSSKRSTPSKADLKKMNGVKVPNGKQKEKKDTATKVPKTSSKGPKSQSNSIPKVPKQDAKANSSQVVVNGKPPKSVNKKKQNSSSDQQRPDESKKENEKVDKSENSSITSTKESCPALQLSPVTNVPQNGEQNLPDNVHDTPLFNFSQEPLTPLYGQTPKISGSSLEIPLPLRGHDMKDTLNVSDFRHSMNGYSGSDQPLDLSPGSKEEYTQGKIFKTKMLKKSYPKADTVLSQKERIVRQNGHQNGYVHSELNKATRTESQNS